MNSAATLMENALILIDLNFRILAHSTTHEIADPIWSETIENGSLSYEFVQKIRSSNEMKEWGKHRNKTQIFSLRDEPTLVAGIAKNGHVMGGIIMLADYSKINHRHLQLIAPIGTLLFDAFHYDSSHELYSSYNRILYNLLDESDLHTTLELIEMSKSNFPPEMQVVVARFILRNETSYIKNTIKKELKRIFPRGFALQYKSYITIVVPLISAEQKIKLNELAQHEEINIGISWPFADVLEVKRFFNQSIASIKQACRFDLTHQVFEYSDFSCYDLLHNYVGKIPLHNFVHPALQILQSYDLENHASLYETLKIYLQNNKNLRITADTLFVHKNSLIYRLKRINDLIDVNLNDSNIIFALIISFKINTFLNSVSHQNPNGISRH